MWVQMTDTTDVCLITVSGWKTVKNSNKICKLANNIINKTLLKDFLWHLLIAVKYREDRGGGYEPQDMHLFCDLLYYLRFSLLINT